MSGKKRAADEQADAFRLLADVFDRVSADSFAAIAKALRDACTNTDQPSLKRLLTVETTLIENLKYHPGLLRRFKDYFHESFHPFLDPKKRRTVNLNKPREIMSKLTDDQKLVCHEALEFTNDINMHAETPSLMKKFETYLKHYNTRKITLKTLLEEEHLLPKLAEFIVIDPQDVQGKSVLDLFKKEYSKYNCTQDSHKVHELDSTTMEVCTPSYAFLPSNYEVPKANGRTKLGDLVLNDEVISISTGTEEVATDQCKNVHENRLFAIEDEMYKTSRMLDLMTSTLQAINLISRIVRNLNDEEAKGFLTESLNLKKIHLHCIRALYGLTIHPPQTMKSLPVLGMKTEILISAVREHPRRGLETLTQSIKLKICEWRQAETDVKSLWQKCFDENYLKSLDYSSQTFKSSERTTLSHQTLLKQAGGSSRLDGVQFVNLESFKIGRDLILDFSNKVVVDCACWAVETALNAFYKNSAFENRCNLWKKLILSFLGLQVIHSVLVPLDVFFTEFPVGHWMTTERNLNGDGSQVLSAVEKLMGLLRKSGESLMYCSESLYFLLMYLDILCKRLKLLENVLYIEHFKMDMIKHLIEDFLYQKMDNNEFEERLTQFAGNNVYPLFTIRELLKKLTAPMEQLLTHPATTLLEHQASALLSLPCYQVEIDQGKWIDEFSNLTKISDLCREERIFHVAFNHQSKKMSIKEVTKEEEALLHFTRWCPVQSEKGPSLQKQKGSQFFLKRNLKPHRPRSQDINNVHKLSSFLRYDKLYHSISHNTIEYVQSSEDWMISLRKRTPDVKKIESKSVAVSAWVKKRVEVLTNKDQPNQASFSADGI
eukprot:g1980.t1